MSNKEPWPYPMVWLALMLPFVLAAGIAGIIAVIPAPGGPPISLPEEFGIPDEALEERDVAYTMEDLEKMTSLQVEHGVVKFSDEGTVIDVCSESESVAGVKLEADDGEIYWRLPTTDALQLNKGDVVNVHGKITRWREYLDGSFDLTVE